MLFDKSEEKQTSSFVYTFYNRNFFSVYIFYCYYSFFNVQACEVFCTLFSRLFLLENIIQLILFSSVIFHLINLIFRKLEK